MEELVIPLRIESASVKVELEKLATQGRHFGAETRKGADDAVDGLENISAAMRRVNLEAMGIQFASQMVGALAEGTYKASAEMRKLAEDFIGLRDRARELAGIMGSKASSQFTTDQLQFAAATGMTGDDALKFRAAFQGEAQQYKGRFGAGEFEQFEKTAAQYAQQMGLGANEAAKLAGNVIRSGPREGATAGDLTKTLGQAFAIVQGGSGDNPILAKQLAETNASMVGDTGPFRTIQEAAVGVRMMAEGNQSEAFTGLQAMQRGLTGLASGHGKGVKAGMGAKLGVDFDTSLLEGVAKLDEAQAASGVGMEQFLTSIFANQEERKGFAMAIKARRGGVETAAAGDAAKVQAGTVEAGVKDYLSDPEQPGQLNIRKAETALREAELSQERVRIASLLQEARTDAREQELKPGVKAMQSIMNMGPFRTIKGLLGQGYEGDEGIEYEGALDIGKRRAREVGVDLSAAGPAGPEVDITASQKDVTHYLSRLVELTEAAQRKPLTAPPPPAGGARP